jgi:hypothetical protein
VRATSSSTVSSVVDRLVAIPRLLALGEVVFSLGIAEDLAYHVAPAAIVPALETVLGVDGELAHLAIFVGMVIVVAGLVTMGLRAGHKPALSPAVDSTRVSATGQHEHQRVLLSRLYG